MGFRGPPHRGGPGHGHRDDFRGPPRGPPRWKNNQPGKNTDNMKINSRGPPPGYHGGDYGGAVPPMPHGDRGKKGVS